MADALVSVRPVLTVGGQTWEIIANNLLSVRVEADSDGMARAEVTLTNLRNDPSGRQEFAFGADTPFRLGVALEVAMGDERSPTRLFRGVVSALGERYQGGTPELLVYAEDPLQRSRMVRRSAVYDNATLGDVMRAVCDRLGKRPRYEGVQESLEVGTLVQLNESDLAFVRRVLAPYDLAFELVDDTFTLRAAASNRPEITLDVQNGLIDAEVVADLADQVTAITVSGWDVDAGEAINVRSRSTSLGPGSGRTGATFLTSPFPERLEHVAHVPVATADEAQAVAEAAWQGRARRFVRLVATARNRPDLTVYSQVRLTGTTPRFANTYRVVSVLHTFDLTAGYTTRFEAECAYLAEAR